MNTVKVDSSALLQIGYDEQGAVLQVVFSHGEAYQYLNVPMRIYWELLNAESKGLYFNRHIRSAFPCVLVCRPNGS